MAVSLATSPAAEGEWWPGVVLVVPLNTDGLSGAASTEALLAFLKCTPASGWFGEALRLRCLLGCLSDTASEGRNALLIYLLELLGLPGEPRVRGRPGENLETSADALRNNIGLELVCLLVEKHCIMSRESLVARAAVAMAGSLCEPAFFFHLMSRRKCGSSAGCMKTGFEETVSRTSEEARAEKPTSIFKAWGVEIKGSFRGSTRMGVTARGGVQLCIC